MLDIICYLNRSKLVIIQKLIKKNKFLWQPFWILKNHHIYYTNSLKQSRMFQEALLFNYTKYRSVVLDLDLVIPW